MDSDEEEVSYEEVEVEVTDEEEEEGEEEEVEEEEQSGRTEKRVEWPPSQSQNAGQAQSDAVAVTTTTISSGGDSSGNTSDVTKCDRVGRNNSGPSDVSAAATGAQPTGAVGPFRPGRLGPARRWSPPVDERHRAEGDQRPNKSRVVIRRQVEDIFQNSTQAAQQGQKLFSSYHVPPGTSRTRKAQEGYTKHLMLQQTTEATTN